MPSGTRFDMPQSISYTTVLARAACSRASTLKPSDDPSNTASSPTETPGSPVTSTKVKSIEMRPTTRRVVFPHNHSAMRGKMAIESIGIAHRQYRDTGRRFRHINSTIAQRLMSAGITQG